MSLKAFYLIAIFRHLEKAAHHKQQRDYWAAIANRNYQAGIGFASYKFTAIDFNHLVNHHVDIVGLLLLLISPPLFYDAKDLIQTGKVNRFVGDSYDPIQNPPVDEEKERLKAALKAIIDRLSPYASMRYNYEDREIIEMAREALGEE